MFASLTKPLYPKAAIGFGNGTVSAVALRRRGNGRFELRGAATSELPVSVLAPSFDEANIVDAGRLSDLLDSLLLEAGLAGQKKWSVSLPSASARTAIITLGEAPASKSELDDVLDWKAETVFGVPADELRVSRIRISASSDAKTRYFATALRLSVLDEYEEIFASLGWQTGLLLPRVIGESNWFSRSAGDSLLISAQHDGFTALLMRNREPVVVRSVTCGKTEIDDEIYRLLVYYQDRFGSDSAGSGLEHLLVLGDGMEREQVRSITREAIGEAIDVVSPDELGFEVPESGPRFEDLAGPAGLASLGWH